MNFVAKVGEILNLEDNNNYQVVDRVKYNEENYLKLLKLPNKLNNAFDFKNLTYCFVQEVIDNEDYYLNFVEDEEIIKNLEV